MRAGGAACCWCWYTFDAWVASSLEVSTIRYLSIYLSIYLSLSISAPSSCATLCSQRWDQRDILDVAGGRGGLVRAVIMDRWGVRKTHREWQWSCPLPRLARRLAATRREEQEANGERGKRDLD